MLNIIITIQVVGSIMNVGNVYKINELSDESRNLCVLTKGNKKIAHTCNNFLNCSNNSCESKNDPIFLKCTNFKDKHENHTSLRFLNIVYQIFMKNHLFCDLLLTYMYWFAATYFHDKNYVINFQQMLKTHYKKLVCSKKYSR